LSVYADPLFTQAGPDTPGESGATIGGYEWRQRWEWTEDWVQTNGRRMATV